jgi:amino acid adenylation domain-containing protein
MYNSTVLLLSEAARKFPKRVAIEDSNTGITYEEYSDLAMGIGTWFIKARAAGPVAVILPKSSRSLLLFMGILYSGNTYVPLDDKMPAARLAKILENLCPLYIITNGAVREALVQAGFDSGKILEFEDVAKEPPDKILVGKQVEKTIDTDPNYIMYTSGSTGMPKGIAITHRSVFDYADWIVSTFGINEESVFGSQAPFYFDNSVLDIYSCLMTGAKLIIIPEELFQFPARLPEFIDEKAVDTIFWIPTVMINVANSGALEDGDLKLTHLKRVMFCGEPMPNKPLNVWRKRLPGVLFANLYGPTEITDGCTYYIVDREFEDSDPLPIGAACKNTRTLILTEDDRKAGTGEIGELCILGSSLALGYWRSPELTEKAFTDNPLNSNYREKIYRTGDLVYQDKEGLIMFVGRKDSQIKHKGNRIELGEIETAAKSIEGIRNACVLYDQKEQQIVLFIESVDESLNLRRINNILIKLVPKYMLPGRLVVMEKLPYNANGKIDRVNLKAAL